MPIQKTKSRLAQVLGSSVLNTPAQRDHLLWLAEWSIDPDDDHPQRFGWHIESKSDLVCSILAHADTAAPASTRESLSLQIELAQAAVKLARINLRLFKPQISAYIRECGLTDRGEIAAEFLSRAAAVVCSLTAQIDCVEQSFELCFPHNISLGILTARIAPIAAYSRSQLEQHDLPAPLRQSFANLCSQLDDADMQVQSVAAAVQQFASHRTERSRGILRKALDKAVQVLEEERAACIEPDHH